MASEGNINLEFMIPRDPEVSNRLHGFYAEIGWDVYRDTLQPYDTYVNPGPLAGDDPPQISYWQTVAPEKVGQFAHNDLPEPSHYARGLRLPILWQLVEVCLVVPSDDTVHAIYRNGGQLLRLHSHVPPREHAGRQEFRFGDPFNFAVRVTARRRQADAASGQVL